MKGKVEMKQNLKWSAIVSICLVVGVSLVLSVPAWSQVNAGSGEVSANIGFNNLTGIDNNKHVEFGFGAGYNFNKAFALLGEYNYLPQGSITVSGVNGGAHYLLYGAAARFSAPTSGRFVPFVVFGGGGAQAAVKASSSGVSVTASMNGTYVTLGGGASVYLNPNLGMRGEYRWDDQRYSQSGVTTTQSDSRGLISLFYQWGGKK